MLAEQAASLREEQRKAILSDNVADLYRIDLRELAAA
jgi:hypothetical protein